MSTVLTEAPSTLAGIKRLAKRIARNDDLQHAKALDRAAQTAGYSNFTDARRKLNDGAEGTPGHFLYLSAYWRDASTGGSGRETLSVVLTHRLADLATPYQLGNVPRLGRVPGSPRDPLRLRRSTKGHTVGFGQTFVGPSRRPDGRMPIAAHQEAAKLLNEVIGRCHYRPGARNRVDRVRSDLDEWVMREYSTAEMSNEIFHSLYYAGSNLSLQRTITVSEAEVLAANLNRVAEILSAHYPASAPLREELRRLTVAIVSVRAWAAKPERTGAKG